MKIFSLIIMLIMINVLFYPLFYRSTSSTDKYCPMPNWISIFYIFFGLLLFLFIKKIKRIRNINRLKNRLYCYNYLSLKHYTEKGLFDKQIKLIKRKLILEKISHNTKNIIVKFLT